MEPVGKWAQGLLCGHKARSQCRRSEGCRRRSLGPGRLRLRGGHPDAARGAAASAAGTVSCGNQLRRNLGRLYACRAGCGIFEAAWDRDGAGGLLGGQPHRALSGKVGRVMIRVRAQDRQGLQAVPPQTSAEESILGGAPEEESQPPGNLACQPLRSQQRPAFLLQRFSSALYWRSMISCRLQTKRVSTLSCGSWGPSKA